MGLRFTGPNFKASGAGSMALRMDFKTSSAALA
jgi:hypothetical protein